MKKQKKSEKNEKCFKRIQITVLLCTILIFAGCNRPQSVKEAEKFVAENVPEEARLINSYELPTNNGTDDEEAVYRDLMKLLK